MRRFFGWALLIATAVTAVAMCGSDARASVTGDTISIAFARDEPPGTPGCVLAPTDVAGLNPSANWINEMGNVGTDGNLTRDTNGVASMTSASLAWSSNNTWCTEGRGGFYNVFTGADETLMIGYLDSADIGGVSGVTWPSIQVTNLPPDMAAGYSVIIYTLSPAVGRNGDYFVNDPGQANPKHVVVSGVETYRHPHGGPNYVPAIGDDPDFGTSGSTNDYGNCVIFTGLKGDLDIETMPQTFRVVINAIQIVKNP